MSYVCKERLIETIRQRTCIEQCPQRLMCHDDLRGECTVNDVMEIVKGFEPDDADEVLHGCWEEQADPYNDNIWVECTECGWIVPMVEHLNDRLLEDYKYCPHCGAVMGEE